MSDLPPHPLDYAPPPPRRRFGLLLLIALAALGVAGVVAYQNSRPPHSARPVANRVKCAENLRQIGNAMLLYAHDHGGKFPDTFEGLLGEGLSAEVFICWESGDTQATGPTTQAIVAQWAIPGHLSYIYCGKGLTDESPAGTIVAYEPLANHGGANSNVLFADGHVAFIPAATMNRILAELAAGRNPPPSARGL
ncbi:MAG TPA: H-X9-DG-CTERM domain-containing protein [Tepidisphaeraceae bacterium]|jgi:prepilin-type processing-associated H-X9-DG protein